MRRGSKEGGSKKVGTIEGGVSKKGELLRPHHKQYIPVDRSF